MPGSMYFWAAFTALGTFAIELNFYMDKKTAEKEGHLDKMLVAPGALDGNPCGTPLAKRMEATNCPLFANPDECGYHFAKIDGVVYPCLWRPYEVSGAKIITGYCDIDFDTEDCSMEHEDFKTHLETSSIFGTYKGYATSCRERQSESGALFTCERAGCVVRNGTCLPRTRRNIQCRHFSSHCEMVPGCYKNPPAAELRRLESPDACMGDQPDW